MSEFFVGTGNTKRANIVTITFSIFKNIFFLVSIIFTLTLVSYNKKTVEQCYFECLSTVWKGN